MKLSGEVAIITGGARGIGKSVAEAFSREGAKVVIASEIQDELVAASKELSVDHVKTDVTEIDDVKKLIDYTVSKYGKIDILINAAGMQVPVGSLFEVSAEAWKKTVEVNLIGTMLCCKFSLSSMITNKKGKIVNFGGGGAISPRPNFSAYASSKTGVLRFTETLAEEVREFNIDVNAIHPGSVHTKMNEDVVEAGLGKAGDAEYKNALDVQGGNTVSMSEVQEFLTFLASNESDGITGKTLYNVWDDWRGLTKENLNSSLYTLRRIDGRRF
jgi:Dehydrogenases with different specificities (related to short-chain alcohol dehydrogenases)